MIEAVKTSDVFVPGRAPLYTYNPRAELELEARLAEYVEDGGSVLALVGPTKTGKSVLLKQNLRNPVWVDGQSVRGAAELWNIVGAALRVASDGPQEQGERSAATASAKGKAIVIEGGGDWTEETSSRRVVNPVVSPTQSAQRALVESRRVLVIDDFHFVEVGAQRDIVRSVKPLVFDGLRVIFSAITHRRHDVPAVVEDMVGRVTPLDINVWTHDELMVIAEKGFETLGVLDLGRQIASRLAHMSFGSPHLMQKLCRELCRDVNGVRETATPEVQLREPDNWDEFFRKQVEQASGRWFTRLLRGPQERTSRNSWTLNDGRSVDGYGVVLKAIGDSGPELSLNKESIRAAVEDTVSGKPPEPHQITRVLQHMSKIAAKSLTDDVPFDDILDDEADDVFTGVQPVVEYVDDGPNSTLHIADPFFAYYLRWGVERHLPVGPDGTADEPLDISGSS